MDHDIKTSISNMDNAEKKLGTWTLPKEEDKKALAQKSENDNPRCDSYEISTGKCRNKSSWIDAKSSDPKSKDIVYPNNGMD